MILFILPSIYYYAMGVLKTLRYMCLIFWIVLSKRICRVSFIKTPNNKTPLFNGGSENDLSSFEKYLENLKLSKKDKKFIMGGLFFAKSKINHFTLMLDAHLKRIFQKLSISPPF